jgi:iron complex outermembrane receptor protein
MPYMKYYRTGAIGLTPLLLSVAVTAAAQEGQKRVALEEVIVTAQKREESLQDTPISITAFGQEALTQQGISSIDDLQGKVPSLNMTPFPTQNTTPRMFIRGVGAGDVQVTQDPAVGVYIDQVYIGRSTGIALDVADLAQIEVLRGPQGTLFGRNSIGGAINMTTRKPETGLLAFKQEAGVGNENLFRAKTSTNIPLTDDLALRAAYFTKERDGWMSNDGPGRDWQDGKDEGGKIDLLWEPNDLWSLRYSYDYSRSEFVNPTFQAIIPAGGSENLEIPVSSGRLNTLSTKDYLGVSDTKVDGHSLAISREWDAGTLKSITAYREMEYWEFTNLESGSPSEQLVLNSNRGIDLLGSRPHLDQDQWSQEFQFLGTLNDNLDYVVGAYYFDEKATQDSASGSFVFFQQPDQYNYFDIENESWAVFAQGNWTPEILDSRLTLTAGIRYTEDDRSAPAVFIYDPDPTDKSFSADPDSSFDNTSYTLVANFAVTDDINTYAKLATGYKSGGYNIRASSEEKYTNGFDEEKITTWELGTKSEFWDHRVRVNAATYFSVYKDIQLNTSDLSTPADVRDTLVFNAGEGEIFGVELDVTALLTEGLTARVSYAYQDADFTEYDDPQNEGKTEDDFVFSNAPDHQYTVGLDYFYPFSFGNLDASINYNWVDDRYDTQNAAEAESGQAVIESYGVWGAYLGLSNIQLGAYGSLTVSLWGKNLDDEEYFTSAPIILQPAGAYDKAVTWGEPRSYGVDLIYNFSK